MSAYLHAVAGVLDRLRHEALAGTCALAGCDRSATGFVESWDLNPKGICAHHTPEAIRRGYHVHTIEDIT